MVNTIFADRAADLIRHGLDLIAAIAHGNTTACRYQQPLQRREALHIGQSCFRHNTDMQLDMTLRINEFKRPRLERLRAMKYTSPLEKEKIKEGEYLFSFDPSEESHIEREYLFSFNLSQ